MLEQTRASAIRDAPRASLAEPRRLVGEDRRSDGASERTTFALRVARILPWSLLVGAFLACLAVSVSLVTKRTVAPGEAEILHEASRIRDGLRLYVDAREGEHEYVGAPSRVWVLYPPFTSWLVSHIPSQHAIVVGRLLSILAFLGTLGLPVLSAPRRNRETAALAALFVGSIFVLWLFTSIIRPDPFAALLTCVLLERVVRLAHVDAVVGLLASVVVLVKPNMSGAPMGLLLGGLMWSRRKDAGYARGALFAATATFLVGLTVLAYWSNGSFVEHFVRSFGHPWTLSNLTSRVVPRLTTVAGPFVLTAWLLLSRRNELSSRIVMTALATSLMVTCVTLSRCGSASNYWLEPLTIALVVVSKRAEWPTVQRLSTQWACLALLTLQASVSAYLAIDGVLDLRESAEADLALVQRAKDQCHGIVRADQPGIEYELNGRVVATNFTLNRAMETGHFPPGRFLDELLASTTTCIITTNAGGEPFSGFIPAARPLLAERFRLDTITKNGSLYVRRDVSADSTDGIVHAGEESTPR